MNICLTECALEANTSVVYRTSEITYHLLFRLQTLKPGPEVKKLFSCSTQLSMKFKMVISIKNIKKFGFFFGSDQRRMLFFPLINVKMPTIVGILTFMSRKKFHSQLS